MKIKLLILISMLISFGIKSQNVIDMPYEFPVKPGTEKWSSFKTGKEMQDACQIPTDILSKLSTKALAETCLNYPLFFEYSAFNNERVGITYIIENFNGLKELSNRNEGVQELLLLYKEMPVDIKTKQISSKIKDNASILHLAYLELLLSNDTFFKHFKSKEFTKLKEITLEKYERKLANKNTYSLYSIEKTLLLGAKVLEKRKKETLSAEKKVKIAKFINEFSTSNPELIQEISKFIYE